MHDVPPGYLVRYGVAGLLGYFEPAAAGMHFDREARVVVHSDRGWEAGTVLCPAEPNAFPAGLQAVPGTLLRLFNAEDERRLAAAAGRAQELFGQAQSALQDLPLIVMDVEVVGEPEAAIIHVVRLGRVDLDDVRGRLAAECGVEIRLEDATSPEAAEEFESGCGDCGSGCSDKADGEGCSGGTCGSGCGSKREFDSQWREYFAELRAKMHAGLAEPRP